MLMLGGLGLQLNVFFQGAESLMTFVNNKLVFQNTHPLVSEANIGLGTIDPESLCYKGRFGFADFKNYPTVIPESYWNIRFFENRGVPRRVFKGVYGDNVVLKEAYGQGVVMRAYDADGTVCLYESEYASTATGKSLNLYFSRLSQVIPEWEDITEQVHSAVLDSLAELSGSLKVNEVIDRAGLLIESSDTLDSGVLVLHGSYEDLIVWGTTQEPHFAWCGTRVPIGMLMG